MKPNLPCCVNLGPSGVFRVDTNPHVSSPMLNLKSPSYFSAKMGLHTRKIILLSECDTFPRNVFKNHHAKQQNHNTTPHMRTLLPIATLATS